MSKGTDLGRTRYILVCCGAAVLAIWWMRAHRNSFWPDFFIQAYLLTGGLFGILLTGDYPPFPSRWFWKSMVPIFVLHSAVILALLGITVQITPTGLHLPTRIVYGLVGVALVLEWWVSLRIIEMFDSSID